ncbi:MAG: hypothetical protein KDD47_20190, partial [Acidobacteria bacterium]|nr:hypothetical protein [Acidobacteriota bacterium]
MRCPRCYSLNVRRSRRRLWERAVCFLLPTLPYRCRSCQGRFWRRSGGLLNLPRLGVLALATVLTIFVAIRTLGLLRPDSQSADPASRPIEKPAAPKVVSPSPEPQPAQLSVLGPGTSAETAVGQPPDDLPPPAAKLPDEADSLAPVMPEPTVPEPTIAEAPKAARVAASD